MSILNSLRGIVSTPPLTRRAIHSICTFITAVSRNGLDSNPRTARPLFIEALDNIDDIPDLDARIGPKALLEQHSSVIIKGYKGHTYLALYQALLAKFGHQQAKKALEKFEQVGLNLAPELVNLLINYSNDLPKKQARQAINVLVKFKNQSRENFRALREGLVFDHLLKNQTDPKKVLAILNLLRELASEASINQHLVTAVNRIIEDYKPEKQLIAFSKLLAHYGDVSNGISIDKFMFDLNPTLQSHQATPLKEGTEWNVKQEILFQNLSSKLVDPKQKQILQDRIATLHNISDFLFQTLLQQRGAKTPPKSSTNTANDSTIQGILEGNDDLFLAPNTPEAQEKYSCYAAILFYALKNLPKDSLQKVVDFVSKLEAVNLSLERVRAIREAICSNNAELILDTQKLKSCPDRQLQYECLLLSSSHLDKKFYTKDFIDIIENNPELQAKVIDYLLAPNDNKIIIDLREGHSELLRLKALTSDFSIINKLMPCFQYGFGLSDFSGQFAPPIDNEKQQQSILIQRFLHLINNLKDLNLPESTLGAFISTILKGGTEAKYIEQIQGKAAALNLSRNIHVSDSQSVLTYTFRVDTPPYPYTDQDSIRAAHKDVMRHLARIFDWHYGFSSLTFDARRKPHREPSFLERFARDSAKTFYHLNSSSKDAFPGKGISIEGLDWASIMGVKNHPAEFTKFMTRYKEAMPWLAEGMDDSAETKYVLLRGMMIVTPPDKPEYFLLGREGEKIHYSLVVYNDHFYGDALRTAYLVPTKIVNSVLGPSKIPEASFRGFVPDKVDVNKLALRPYDWRQAAEAEGLNVLDWGTASLFGGMANSYPPKQKPFELVLNKKELFPDADGISLSTLSMVGVDAAGHIHKDVAPFARNLGLSEETWIAKLQQSHEDLTLLSERYGHLINAFNLALANRHKGISDISDQSEIRLSDDIQESAPEGELFMVEDDAATSVDEKIPLQARNQVSLFEAYRWHRELNEQAALTTKVALDEDFPVLTIADTFAWSQGLEKPSFLLDTKTMKGYLRQNDGSYRVHQFGINKPGERDELIWQKYITPVLFEPSKDLRFYHRELIKGVELYES